VLGDVGAVEQERVDAGLTIDYVVVVAWVLDKHIVPRAHEGDVAAIAANDEVVALAAEENVGTQTAVEGEADLDSR
jgi:microcompartment protein CcmL/EutN